jgi:hypothetical protein
MAHDEINSAYARLFQTRLFPRSQRLRARRPSRVSLVTPLEVSKATRASRRARERTRWRLSRDLFGHGVHRARRRVSGISPSLPREAAASPKLTLVLLSAQLRSAGEREVVLRALLELVIAGGTRSGDGYFLPRPTRGMNPTRLPTPKGKRYQPLSSSRSRSLAETHSRLVVRAATAKRLGLAEEQGSALGGGCRAICSGMASIAHAS